MGQFEGRVVSRNNPLLQWLTPSFPVSLVAFCSSTEANSLQVGEFGTFDMIDFLTARLSR